jgi:hypothetical protein
MKVRWRLVLRLLLVPLLWNEFLGLLACLAITVACAVRIFVAPSLVLALVPLGCTLVALQFSWKFLDRLEKWHPYS